MKKTTAIFIHLIAVSLLLSLSNCKDVPPEPEPTEVEKRTTILTTGGTWNLQSVTVDGVDKTSTYAPMTLSFTSSNFTTTHGGTVWPASGTWHFNDGGTMITRNDNLQINVNEISQNKLVLALAWATTTLGPGRTTSIAGPHVFTFTR